MSTEALVQWDQVVTLKRSHLDSLIVERTHHKAEIEEISAKVAKIDAKIMAALSNSGVKTVGVGEGLGSARVTLVIPEKPPQKFDRAVAMRRLLELGVEEKKISKAWKDAITTGELGSPYVKVTISEKE